MRDDFTDDDIYGRDKLRRSVMEAWYDYYQILKDELRVMSSTFNVQYQYY